MSRRVFYQICYYCTLAPVGEVVSAMAPVGEVVSAMNLMVFSQICYYCTLAPVGEVVSAMSMRVFNVSPYSL